MLIKVMVLIACIFCALCLIAVMNGIDGAQEDFKSEQP